MNKPNRDEGSILPMVMVMTVVLSAVIVSLASYVVSGLKYSNIVEDRADRLAAADGGLRYGIERLKLQEYAPCFTTLGNTGYQVPFPAGPTGVNGSAVTVTCRKSGVGFGSMTGWAVVVTGQGVPNGEWNLHSQGGNGQQKLLGGPIYVNKPSIMDLQAQVEIKDGDLWYSDTGCATTQPNPQPSRLSFTPALRGMMCLDQPWGALFTAPAVPALPTTLNPAPVSNGGCKVFSPGRYTVHPPLGNANYFKAGDYLFDNVHLNIDKTVTAGFAGIDDQQYIPNAQCAAAIDADRAAGGSPGATFYLGGTSDIYVEKGQLEILRRQQGEDFVSIQALATSVHVWDDIILHTKEGNGTDMAVHGLAWAPKAQLTFGNVTNAANAQFLGGVAFARIDMQASASASNFVIRVKTGPTPVAVVLDAVATKAGHATTMRAVVQINSTGTQKAINSWRVVD